MQQLRLRGQAWIARHPRVTITLVMLVLLVALSGGVAADGVGTSEAGCVSGGPTDPDATCS